MPVMGHRLEWLVSYANMGIMITLVLEFIKSNGDGL